MSGLTPPNVLSYLGQVVVPFINRSFAPETTFTDFNVPTIWIDTSSLTAYVLVGKAQNVATWVPIGGSPGGIYSITTPDSTVVTPTDSNVDFLDGTGMSITGSGSNVTFAVAGTIPNTFTGNSGSAAPSSHNVNILGTGSVTTVAASSTVTVELTGLTAHNVLVGAGTTTITKVSPSSTSGVPLISQGTSSDPAFGTATVPGGGTGATTFTSGGVLYGNGTSALQSTSSGTSGQVLQSGGSGNSPVYTTATYPSTGASGTLIYASAANTFSTLSPTASAVLTTTSGSVPQWSTKVPGTNGASLQLVSSQNVSGVSSVSFTNLSSYGSVFYVVLSEVQGAVNGGVLEMLVSNNNGSSYATTGYNSGVTYSGYNSTTLYNSNSSSAAVLTASQNNGSVPCNGFLYLYNFNVGTYFVMNGMMSWNDSSLSQLASSHSLTCSGTTGVNAIKFSYSNGNISSGIFSLYSITTT